MKQRNPRDIEIGEKIRQFRKKKMTQAELAQRISRTESSIRKYESGQTTIPLDVIEKIASALGVTAFDLMGVEYWDKKAPSIAKEVERIETFESFLKSFGYSMKFLQEDEEGESCTVELTKDGHSAEFTQSEFEELENCAKEAIDGRFYKKVVEQQHKK